VFGIADCPSQVGLETTHAASTSGRIGKGRRRSSAREPPLVDRRSATPYVQRRDSRHLRAKSKAKQVIDLTRDYLVKIDFACFFVF
jgi:hypothetical protein